MEVSLPAGEDPVVYEPALGQWFVFGYDEVRSALADERLTHDRRGQLRGGFLELVADAAANHGRELDDETVGNVTMPFLTGQIGVAHLTANTVWLLLTHDDARARVAADPSLLAGAIAETLRYVPAVMLIARFALEPVTLGGHVIRAGDLVQLSVGAANRNPTRFPDPDRFDITRPRGGALGFGYGAHSCIAAGLSRMQTPIAVGALLERAADLELDPAREPVWSAVPGVRGIEGLTLRRPAGRAARRPR
jgi:cytochrome P450